MLLPAMRYCRNFFNFAYERARLFTISGGTIGLSGDYTVGLYIIITGSDLSNGIYKIISKQEISERHFIYGLEGGNINEIEEQFNGIVYISRIPQDFLDVVADIQSFIDEQGVPSNVKSVTNQNYRDELFSDKNGNIADWQDIFNKRLAPFKRMFTNIEI